LLDTVEGAGFVEIPGHKIPMLRLLILKDYLKQTAETSVS
jgi:hypothetical protein